MESDERESDHGEDSKDSITAEKTDNLKKWTHKQ